MVIDFIAENSEDLQLSMRLLGPACENSSMPAPRGWIGDHWLRASCRPSAASNRRRRRLDSRSHDLRVLREALKRFPESVKDQMAYFCVNTKKSRASFYRILSRLRDEEG